MPGHQPLKFIFQDNRIHYIGSPCTAVSIYLCHFFKILTQDFSSSAISCTYYTLVIGSWLPFGTDFPFSLRGPAKTTTVMTLIYLFLWFWLSLVSSSCLFFCAVSKCLTSVCIALVNMNDRFIEDSAFLLCSLSAKYRTKLFWRLLFKSRHQKYICLLLF